MANLEATPATSSPNFPAAELASILREHLIKVVRARFRRKGLPLPTSDDEVVVMVVELDSMTVVELLSNLDDLVPFKVTESVVKAGGYDTISAAVEHVVGRLAAKWAKHHSGVTV
ncbi:hypothetical protein [Phenylobacterium sp.]|uniref:hypothetical protein n=1 Tax=Phenylobacterium sp. TaxID=1871053 RepID=UPI00121E39DD|nr:hypothetical protein [Phenylobacterium sp.]THD61607.1 MAG: hypothetical protein E8A49_11595 [Phenylobacterium sp.]